MEGNRISLEWNYTLVGSTLRDAEFSTTNTNPVTKIVILDTEDISNNQPAFIPPLYTGRVQANITASQAIITFLSVNRTDSGNYELHLTRESDRQQFISSVTITVQCKYKRYDCTMGKFEFVFSMYFTPLKSGKNGVDYSDAFRLPL